MSSGDDDPSSILVRELIKPFMRTDVAHVVKSLVLRGTYGLLYSARVESFVASSNLRFFFGWKSSSLSSAWPGTTSSAEVMMQASYAGYSSKLHSHWYLTITTLLLKVDVRPRPYNKLHITWVCGVYGIIDTSASGLITSIIEPRLWSVSYLVVNLP